MSKITIDLSKYGGPVFTGRNTGENIRTKCNLELVDKETDTDVFVLVPDNTFSLNSSFFLGMFGKSIRAAGSREKFLDKFTFKCPPHIVQYIESGIERALLERSNLLP